MDKQLITEKLDALQRCVKRLEDKCPDSLETLLADLDRQDIITLNLARAVQICVDIAAHILSEKSSVPPASMGQSFEALQEVGIIDETLARQMKAAVGFRNIAIHEYEEINWEIVLKICEKHLADFKRFARAISDCTLH